MSMNEHMCMTVCEIKTIKGQGETDNYVIIVKQSPSQFLGSTHPNDKQNNLFSLLW